MQLVGSNIWEGAGGAGEGAEPEPHSLGTRESRPPLDSLPKSQKQKPQPLPSPRCRSLGPQQPTPRGPKSTHFLIPPIQCPRHPLR